MRHFRIVAAFAFVLIDFFCFAQEKDPAQQESDPRMKVMREVIEAMEVRPVDPDSKLSTKLERNPILRFGDPTRETTDGVIWKLGAGRPRAILALEFTRYVGEPTLSYEFLCLTDEKFDLHTKQGWKWSPSESALTLQILDGVAPPNKSKTVRLRQMKSIARRFSASEHFNEQDYNLRLMPQPIDQYSLDESEGRHTGAIFVFAHGTNPEVLMVLESSDAGWQYGFGRLTGAAPAVKVNDRVVWQRPSTLGTVPSWKHAYQFTRHSVPESLYRQGKQ